MCRLVMEKNARDEQERKVYGVLTDYDLSSWKEDLKRDYTRTSQQRTGTPPYMAQELLQGTSPIHLYRHDVESLFYIMLLLGARHTIGPLNGGPDAGARFQVVMREDTLPYQRWFIQRDYGMLGSDKYTFILNEKAIELSPAFEGLRPWLEDLQTNFSDGFTDKIYHEKRQRRLLSQKQEPGGITQTLTLFDDETLGGHVDYSTIVESIRGLKGQLKGLIVRYKPTSPPLPTPTGAVQVDARAGS